MKLVQNYNRLLVAVTQIFNILQLIHASPLKDHFGFQETHQ